MSLSAVNKECLLFNPSQKIQAGFERKNIQASYRSMTKKGLLFCPHCFIQNNLEPVLFRSGGESKRDHFFHASSSSKCSYSPTTEKHINAQSWIAYSLQRKYPDSKVSIEFKLKNQDISSRPDVCMHMPDGSLNAFEIQISKITEYEVKIRTKKLLDFGCKDVTWFFTAISSSELIENQLAIMNQNHLILTFNDDNSVQSVIKTDLVAVKKRMIQSSILDGKVKLPKQINRWIYNFILHLNIDWFIFLVYANTELKKQIGSASINAVKSQNKATQSAVEKVLMTCTNKAYRHAVNQKIYVGMQHQYETNTLNLMWVTDVEEGRIKTIPCNLLIEL